MPKLRFPGFEGEWHNDYIGNLSSYIKGASLSKADISENGTPFLLYGELYTTYKEVTRNIKRKTQRVVGEEYYSKVGDVVIPTSGETPEEIATATCIMIPGVILAGDLNIFRTRNIDGRFFSYLINHKVNNEISRIAQGKSVVHIKGDEISKILIKYPDSREQTKILTFLELLAARIDKQERLIETLKKYKRGLLDKIFPPKKDSPSLTVRLSKMADFLQGLTYSPIDIANSGYLVLRSSNIQNAALSFDDCVYVDMEIPTHLQVKQGDIIMCVRNGSKKLVGKSAKIPCEMPMTTWGAFMMIIRSKIDGSYIYQYLNSQAFYSQVFKDTGTATINQITKGILNECEIPLPPKSERDRITTLLEGFDKRIESTYFSLLKMQDLRKSLLQQLFI